MLKEVAWSGIDKEIPLSLLIEGPALLAKEGKS